MCKALEVDSRQEWRTWLSNNHESKDSVWLKFYKVATGKSVMSVSESIEDALCYAWIDSKKRGIDEESYEMYFSPRNPKSNWSRSNKNVIARLEEEGRLEKAGNEMVLEAKETGTWDALNDVENLVIPLDLMLEFKRDAAALEHWKEFPRNVKRATLEWIFKAKREETRARRIEQTVAAAADNERLF